MKCGFSATPHVLLLTGVTAFLSHLGKRYFCKRGRTGLHFEFRALSVFIATYIFLDAYNVYNPNKKICTCEKTKFALNEKMHSNVE